MCMEDVILGREKVTAARPVTLANGASTPLVAENASRTHLSIHTSGGNVAIAPDGCDPTTAGVFVTGVTLPSLEFDVETHGDIVTKAWTGAGIAGAVTVVVLESFLFRRK